jgi:predicted dehydrogenase
MGKAYAIALSSVSTVFGLPVQAVCEMIATSSEESPARMSRALGFRRSTGDWRALVSDPEIDVVGICSPTYLHREMALAAIAAGKHVLCEKPVALNATDAGEMASAAERAGVKTLVGYNYAKNPATQLAKEIIDGGEIGGVIHFRGTHNEDYLRDPSSPAPQGRFAILARILSTSRIISAAKSTRSSDTLRRFTSSVQATAAGRKRWRTTMRRSFSCASRAACTGRSRSAASLRAARTV